MALSSEIYKLMGMPYEFKSSPRIDFEGKSANCQRAVHLLYKARPGMELPKGMWSKEIYEDEKMIFETVDPGTDRLFEADILIFGPKGKVDPKNYHLTYYSGQTDESGDPLIAHANSYDLAFSVWPLSKFFQYERYGELKRIKRVRPDLFKVYIMPLIHGSY